MAASEPPPPSYTSAANGGGASLTEFPKLYADTRQRRKYEDLADFFAIVKVTEHLERAYIKSAISQDEYTKACKKLISQFKTSELALLNGKTITNTAAFMNEFQMDCPLATERLLNTGVPATTLHSTQATAPAGAVIAETTQVLITCMDALKLEQRAVDDIHPLVSDVMSSITKVPNLPKDFEGLDKLKEWLETLNKMRATDEIDDDQARQLTFDLDMIYGAFHRWLQQQQQGH